ncbi:MAG: tRNA threonylcarbamoyladenosine dehydratase [Bacilli bacterium]|nr:tRNA threonylcarbamoyladenosine dehydratase [Bacilli bacterium]
MFDKLNKLISEKHFKIVQNTHVLLVGIGGVGGYAFEALVRSGIGKITIIDHDVIDITNLNRQIITNQGNINQKKIAEAKKRALEINPGCEIITHDLFLDESNIDEIFKDKFDYIIDACDTITTKVLLVKKAQELNIKLISCMGTGNRLDPSKVMITKLNKTYNDPLAKVMRKLLKDNNLKTKINVVWSSELPIKTGDRKPSSIILVPSVAGINAASYIINDILKTDL